MYSKYGIEWGWRAHVVHQLEKYALFMEKLYIAMFVTQYDLFKPFEGTFKRKISI